MNASDLIAGPSDFMEAHEKLGAMCGHGALAAALDAPVMLVCRRLFAADLAQKRGWVNLPRMEQALNESGRNWHHIGKQWPKCGLAMIQWEGPWTKPGVPPRVACMHRHWIATEHDGGLVWDINLEMWVPRSTWEEFAPELFPPKCTGWSVARGYELKAQPETDL